MLTRESAQQLFQLGHRPALDGIRGLAVMAVLLFHAGVPLLRGGSLGVDIFFVLSGFLITSLLLEEYRRHGAIDWRGFYARRFLRLLPALLLIVFCYLALVPFLPNPARHLIDALLPLTYLTNWIRAVGIGMPDYMGHTWSLSIEEQFYVLWPITLLLLIRKDASWRLALGVSVAGAVAALALRVGLLTAGAGDARIYNGLDTRADALLVGCALALALCSGRLTRPVRAPRLETAMACGVWGLLLALAAGSEWNHAAMLGPGYSLIAVLSALAILFVIRLPEAGLTRLLACGPLVWLGRLSYGIYLWHYPIVRIVKPYAAGWPEVVVATAVFTLAAAAVSYYLVEQRFLRLKSRFGRRGRVGGASLEAHAERVGVPAA